MLNYKNDGKTASINVSFGPVWPLFTGWILMLVMGGLHNDVNASVPNLTYWLCVGIMVVIQIVVWLLAMLK